MYLSQDEKHLAYFTAESGGWCSFSNNIKVLNTDTLKLKNISDLLGHKFSYSAIVNLFWKNNEEIEFEVYKDNDCRDDNYIKNIWQYNLKKEKAELLKSNKIYFDT